MKTILAVTLCLLACIGVFAQTDENIQDKIGVEEITLTRDDGNDKPGEQTDSFTTTDIPIHFRIQLCLTKAVTVKMNLVAVQAAGLKAGSSIISASYATNGKQSGVRFNASPKEKAWAAGKYRVDIFLNGKFAKSLQFEINKSPQQVEKEKQAPPKPATNRSKRLRHQKNA